MNNNKRYLKKLNILYSEIIFKLIKMSMHQTITLKNIFNNQSNNKIKRDSN